MKKQVLFLLLAILLWQCNKENETSPNTIDINEGQNNWTKVLIAQRPTGDLPSQHAGEYCPVRVLPIFTSSDTISFFVNFYKNSPYTSVFISYHNAQTFVQKIAFNGTMLSLDQQGIYAYGLRQENNSFYFGKSLNYGTTWTWTLITFLPYQVLALHEDTILLLHKYGLHASYNGGSQWSLISSTPFTQMFKLTKQIWLAKDKEIYLLKNLQQPPQFKSSLPYPVTILYQKDSLMLAGTQGGGIYLSKDTAFTWQQVYYAASQFPATTSYQISDIYMIDPFNGFAILNSVQPFYYSSAYPQTLSIILKTSDGGKTWFPNYISQLVRFEKLTTLGTKIIAAGYEQAHPYLSGIYILVTSTMGN